ncbi:hypothetical protein Neosp_004472 [[Neocosmospora] mangrovei]
MHGDMREAIEPRRLEGPWSAKRLLTSLLDLALAAGALLFVLFGGLIYMNDGSTVTPGSTGKVLLDIAKYGPTVFPVLFAAIVGGALKTFATWRVQNGTQVGMIEQLVGSHTVTGALFTQARLKAFNLLAVIIVLLWCLSPLGSQAALRAISADHVFRNETDNLTVMESFAPFRYYSGGSTGGVATRRLVPSFIASMLSARLLQDRNQDIWGNIRVPLIERLTDRASDTDWIDLSGPQEVIYSSLIGIPVASLPSKGNHTFTISASYVNVECPTVKVLPEDYFAATVPDFNSSDESNCQWTTRQAEQTLRVRLSQPCGRSEEDVVKRFREGKDRPARVFIWESRTFGEKGHSYAECHLYTTYVDIKMQCQGTLCSPASIRRSPNPARHGNWTLFDMAGSIEQPESFTTIFANMFPGSNNSGGQVPTVTYLLEPLNALSADNRTQPGALPRERFETGLTQMINSQLLLGIRVEDVTGSFTAENPSNLSVNVVEMETYTRVELVKYSTSWLILLLASSVVLFAVAMAAIVVRFRILVPDVLGSLALGMLDNRCDNIKNSSFMSGDDKMAKIKNVKVMLGDVEPHAEIGRIALAALMEDVVVGKVQKGKFYL